MKVSISSITVGTRRRQDLGDIDALAASIQQYGILHPIVIDDANRLVAGERRLRACELLGWPEIEVKQLGELTDQELREIEIEENLRRKDLTDYERSRKVVELAETARTIVREQTALRATMTRNASPERGRPREAGSYRDIEDRTGIPQPTIRRAEHHVAAVERYPVLTMLPQGDALTVAKNLDRLPEDDREQMVEALAKNDVDALAKLADRPPLPKGPTPHQETAEDPGVKWTGVVYKIVVVLNSIRDHGGFADLAARWSHDSKVGYLQVIQDLKSRLDELESTIQQELADDEHAA